MKEGPGALHSPEYTVGSSMRIPGTKTYGRFPGTERCSDTNTYRIPIWTNMYAGGGSVSK